MKGQKNTKINNQASAFFDGLRVFVGLTENPVQSPQVEFSSFESSRKESVESREVDTNPSKIFTVFSFRLLSETWYIEVVRMACKSKPKPKRFARN